MEQKQNLRELITELADEVEWLAEKARGYGPNRDLVRRAREAAESEDYPEPTSKMLDGDPLFDAIWGAIKGWNISRHNDGLYQGPTGNDVRHIYEAVKAVDGHGIWP
jgi:hypothetical protein